MRRPQAHLDAAAQIYALADTNPTGDLVTTMPRDYYPEDSWHDDLAAARQATHDPFAAADGTASSDYAVLHRAGPGPATCVVPGRVPFAFSSTPPHEVCRCSP